MSFLPQVIIGSERSRIRATLPFYFTRRFLDAPLTQRQRTASEQWRTGAGAAGGDGRGTAGGNVEAGLGTQHGSTASIASTDGGDVALQGSRLQQGDCQGSKHSVDTQVRPSQHPVTPWHATLPSLGRRCRRCCPGTAGRQLHLVSAWHQAQGVQLLPLQRCWGRSSCLAMGTRRPWSPARTPYWPTRHWQVRQPAAQAAAQSVAAAMAQAAQRG